MRHRSNDRHPDIYPLSANTIINDCAGTYSFRIFWNGPDDDRHSNREADRWAAHINTRGNAQFPSYTFDNPPDSTAFVDMYGQVRMHGRSELGIRVRGHYGDDG